MINNDKCDKQSLFHLKKNDHEYVSHHEILYIYYSLNRICFFKREEIKNNKINYNNECIEEKQVLIKLFKL